MRGILQARVGLERVCVRWMMPCHDDMMFHVVMVSW